MRLSDYYEYSKNRARALQRIATDALRRYDWRKRNAKELDEFGISDDEVSEAIPAQRIYFLNYLLQQAQTGVNWLETAAAYIQPMGFSPDEVIAYIEQNWSMSEETRNRKALVRKLAMIQLLRTDWQSQFSDRMENLKVTPDMVIQYANRMLESDYGRQNIINQILLRATGRSKEWQEDYKAVMQAHGIAIEDIELKVQEKCQVEQMRKEHSELIKQQLSKRRKIMNFLDVAEHPEFTPDELTTARTQALLPEFKDALIEALVKKIRDGKKIHPNYYESMRVQGISMGSVFEAARKSTINSIINSVEVEENPNFKNRATDWHNSLRAIDSKLLTVYSIAERDLENHFRAALRGLLLRDVCLKRPSDDRWIAHYIQPMSIARLTESDVRTQLSETENLDWRAIEKRFYEMLSSEGFAAHRALGLEHHLLEFQNITKRFKALWRESYAELGDISFTLEIFFDIDIEPRSDFRIKLRGADLLDTQPTVQTEEFLISTLNKLAKQIESEQHIYSWSDSHNFHAGLPIEIYDGDGKWEYNYSLP